MEGRRGKGKGRGVGRVNAHGMNVSRVCVRGGHVCVCVGEGGGKVKFSFKFFIPFMA